MKPKSLQRRKRPHKSSKRPSIYTLACSSFGALGVYLSSSRSYKYGYGMFKASQQPLSLSELDTSFKDSSDSRTAIWPSIVSSLQIRIPEQENYLVLRTYSSNNASLLLESPPLPPPPPPSSPPLPLSLPPFVLNKQSLPSSEQARRGLAIVTVGSHQHNTFENSEYGEIKAAFMYSVSVANKARYCEYHSCTLVVGGPVLEAVGRSARWLKVAWLRRMLDTVATAENNYVGSFAWVVWMDLDTIFAHPRMNLSSTLDANYDLHLTPDFLYSSEDAGQRRRSAVNTGFFAVRATPWSRAFIESVWKHNDRGRGLCDQAAINRLLRSMPRSERSRHVKIYSKEVLNAFPRVSGRYLEMHSQSTLTLPLDLDLKAHKLGLNKIVHSIRPWAKSQSAGAQRIGGYDGDENVESTMIYHFAGIFGGANSYTGQSSSIMLAQALDLLIELHQSFLARLQIISDANQILDPSFEQLRAARKVLASCRWALLEAANATHRLDQFSELEITEGSQFLSHYVVAAAESTSRTFHAVEVCESVLSSPELRSSLANIGSKYSSTQQNQLSWPSSILCNSIKPVTNPKSLPLAQPCGQARPLWSRSVNEIHFLPVQCAHQNLQNYRSYKIWIPYWSTSERLMAHRLLEKTKSSAEARLPSDVANELARVLKHFEKKSSGGREGARTTGLGKSARLTVATSGCAFTQISATGTVAYDDSNRIQDWDVHSDSNDFAEHSEAENSSLLNFNSLALFPPVFKSSSRLHSLDSGFWLDCAPMLLAYFALLPNKNTVGELVGDSLNEIERVALSKLGIPKSRWSHVKPLHGRSEGNTQVSLRKLYANELFTFFIAKRPDRPNFSAMHDSWLDVETLSTEWHELQDGVQTASTWLLAEALHEFHNSTPFNNQQQRHIVVACSSLDNNIPLTCDEQFEALSDAFGSQGSAEPFTVVQWHGGANLLDHDAAALMRNASILIAADADELLLGLLGPAQPFLAVPLENRQFFNNPHHSKPLLTHSEILPPETAPLAVVYWHNMGDYNETTSDTVFSPETALGASAFFSRRARALAAIGLDIWPMPWWAIRQRGEPRNRDLDVRAAFIRAVRAAIH